ncbi:MAG TPA: WD40 repeat domain-containing protein [Candidatus Limnocylindrales bacterium]|nr:WD40 repeat domain-containing protein [Candidatus Limnocylindrales bacterium]
MPRAKRETRGIVRGQSSGGITVLSSSLVLRGLREFPQTPRWNIKQVFSEPRPYLSISPQGHIATYSAASRELSQRLEIWDLELAGAPSVIRLPDEPLVAHPDFPASFAWSPGGRSLIAASGTWQPELHYIGARDGKLAGRFAPFRVFPAHLCWSDSGEYFVAAADGSEDAALTLWMAGDSPEQFEPLCQLDRATFAAAFSDNDDSGDRGHFWGFGATAFQPGDKSFATVLEFDGDWSDDSIVLVRPPALETIAKFDTSGHVTDLSWCSDARHLIFCASGQAYSLDSANGSTASLPFAAELCHCHPSLPVCAFYNSWLKSSARGRIFVADLQRSTIIDECWAEGIASLRWSQDGHTLYAVSQDGAAYLFDSPLA